MLRKNALMAAGVAVGLVMVGVLMDQEEKAAAAREAEIRDGLYAEITGNTVRMYKVRDGHFCGYTETKVFDSHNEAVEWVARETSAKMVFKDENN